MKIPLIVLASPLLCLLAADATAADRPHLDAWSARAARPAAPQTAPDRHSTARFVVLARDPGRGAPSLLRAVSGHTPPASATAIQAARHHLTRHRGAYQVGRAVIAGARHRFTHDSGHGGLVVALRQTVGGVEVFHGDIKVLLDRDRRLVGIAGSPHPAAHPGSARSFVLSRPAAVALALRDLYGVDLVASALRSRGGAGGWERFDLAAARVRFHQPARARPVYFPLGDQLVPAHLVELQSSAAGSRARDVYQYVIADDDGRLLYRRDATDYESFNYRVWADPDGDHRPHDGPVADWTPHPTGDPNGGAVPATAPVLVAMEGFNHNPDDLPDPWLPPGATETRGNNVDAYVDHTDPQGLSDGEYRASVTAPGTFDRVYDTDAEPLVSQHQSMAAATQLFYVINWMHDWWYDSGFTEAAGNAQFDNFGRGGEDGDILLAEAQDAALLGARNNANMSTPLDGASPRMQMYLWSPLDKNAALDVAPLNQGFTVGMATFGPNNYDVTGDLVLFQDGVGPNPTDGCTAPVNDLVGKIALVDRGNCSFETKSSLAAAAGASGVLIANNVDSPVALGPGSDNNIPDPAIPTQGLFMADGAALKAALENGPQTAHMTGETGPERDGTLDNMIVAHEWGHYIHHRLVDCGSKMCSAMSEGWGDWFGLHMVLRDGDDLDGTYADALYAASNPYFGIRRVPYSVSPAANALSFRHVSKGEVLPQGHPMQAGPADNSEVHNAGEIWASMLWEAYVALHKAHSGDLTFDQVRRLMGDYVVAGMMMAPTEPTFTQQRDAILMAIGATSTADMVTVAQAFAVRGAGTCAVSPPTTSTDFVGVIEDLGLQADLALLSLTVDDDLFSCDNDGVVDLGEAGTIRVQIQNRGMVTMPAGSLLEVLDPDPALVFPGGPSLKIGALEPLEQAELALEIALAPDIGDTFKSTHIKIRLTTPAGCVTESELRIPAMLNGDVQPGASSLDDVEVPTTVWTEAGTETGVWSRQWDDQGYFWHGADTSHQSDTWLTTPPLAVGNEPFVVTFDHTHDFEFSDNTYWDGGVIELTSDDGQTWHDVSEYGVIPGYGGDINSAANPIDGRQAFVAKNPMHPDFEEVVLDFGDVFTGQTIKLRFRIGTDAAAGGPGWDLDNIAFAGILNLPFGVWIADQSECIEQGTTGDTTDGDTTAGDTTTGDTTTGTTTTGTTTEGTTTTDALTTDPLTTGMSTTTTTGPDPTTTGITTQDPTTTSTTDPDPTTGPDPTSPTNPTTLPGTSDTSSDTSESSGDSATASGGQTGTDDGCGCTSGSAPAPLAQLLPLLGLLGLRRRRRPN